MKKFNFSLDKVLVYKEKIEENLKIELSEIIAAIEREEGNKRRFEEEHSRYSRELEKEKLSGCTINQIQMYESYLHNITLRIKRLEQVIIELKSQEEKKLEELLEAKKETSSIDKIKEKRYLEHLQQEKKAEEKFIEEFVSNRTDKIKKDSYP